MAAYSILQYAFIVGIGRNENYADVQMEVTLGMIVTGTLPWARGLLLFPAQMLGGIVAAALVACLFPGPLVVETKLNAETSIARGVFIEMFLTAELVLTVLFLAAEKSKATFIAPVGIGLALFVAELTGSSSFKLSFSGQVSELTIVCQGVLFTGGSLNPTRSFGPCVVNREFPGHHWIYWIGPFLGALISAGYYKFAKFFNYEEANPGQDASHNSEENSDKNR